MLGWNVTPNTALMSVDGLIEVIAPMKSVFELRLICYRYLCLAGHQIIIITQCLLIEACSNYMSCHKAVLIQKEAMPYWIILRSTVFHNWSTYIISMSKTPVTPLLTHASYCSLALSHRYGLTYAISNASHAAYAWHAYCTNWIYD